MISVEDMVQICRAVELLQNGVDITAVDNLKQYYNPKTKKLQARLSEHIPAKFVIKFDDASCNFLDWVIGEFVIRNSASYNSCFSEGLQSDETTVNATVTLETLKEIMTVLYRKKFATFSTFRPSSYDPEYEKMMEEQRKNFDDTNLDDAKEMIEALSNGKVRQNLEVLLTLSQYDKALGKEILKAFDTNEIDFELKGFEKYKIVDKRLYIKIPQFAKDDIENGTNRSGILKEFNYLVISRNPYDYYFCSWGSSIQSCFSLNSTCRGWHGAIPLSISKGHFLMYGTSGVPNKANIINGTKWYCPRMLFRCWAWLTPDNSLMCDKFYIGTEYNSDMRLCDSLRNYVCNMFGHGLDWFLNSHHIKLKYGKELANIQLKYDCHWYPDSVGRVNDNTEFEYRGMGYGVRSFIGHDNFGDGDFHLCREASRITKVPDTFHYTDQYNIVDGILTGMKKCPITQLPILDTDSQSKYAKYFVKPVTSLIVITYLDGCFKLDTFSERHNTAYFRVSKLDSSGQLSFRNGNEFMFTPQMSSTERRINIKTFKEIITGAAKNSGYDCVLVRYIEDDRVTFVKYKGK